MKWGLVDQFSTGPPDKAQTCPPDKAPYLVGNDTHFARVWHVTSQNQNGNTMKGKV